MKISHSLWKGRVRLSNRDCSTCAAQTASLALLQYRMQQTRWHDGFHLTSVAQHATNCRGRLHMSFCIGGVLGICHAEESCQNHSDNHCFFHKLQCFVHQHLWLIPESQFVEWIDPAKLLILMIHAKFSSALSPPKINCLPLFNATMRNARYYKERCEAKVTHKDTYKTFWPFLL